MFPQISTNVQPALPCVLRMLTVSTCLVLTRANVKTDTTELDTSAKVLYSKYMQIHVWFSKLQFHFILTKCDIFYNNISLSFLFTKSRTDVILFSDINECSTGAAVCSKDADCINLSGTYTCKCKDGYNGTGYVCEGTTFIAHANSAKYVLLYNV